MISWQGIFGIIQWPMGSPRLYWTGDSWDPSIEKAKVWVVALEAVYDCPDDGLVIEGRTGAFFTP